MNGVFRDLKCAVRVWRQSPALPLAFVITLAAGVGANVAVFSVLRASLMRELPYPDATALVWVAKLSGGPTPAALRLPEFDTLRMESRSFERLAACEAGVSAARGDGDAEQILLTRVTEAFFPVFGLSPLAGRVFDATDYRADSRVLVLSFDLWASQFEGASDVVGRSVRLNRESYTVVGVMPEAFASPCASQRGRVLRTVFVPLVQRAESGAGQRKTGSPFVSVFGRLAPRVTIPGARAEVESILGRGAGSSREGRNPRVQMERLADIGVDAVRPGLLMLQGIAGLLLVIACGNLANLVLAGASARYPEIAVRLALGASRARVLQQFVTETAALGSVAAGLGIWLAYVVLPFLVRLGGLPLLPRATFGVRLPELAFGVALSWLVAASTAVAPALSASRADTRGGFQAALHTGGGRWVRYLREALVAIQVLLAVLVLTGAALFAKGFAQVFALPLGYDGRGLIAAELTDLQAAGSEDDVRQAARRAEQAVRARLPTPLVAFSSDMPFLGAGTSRGSLLGLAGVERRDCYSEIRSVSLDYFDVLALPLVKGASLRSSGVQRPAVISEAFLRRYSKGRSLLGFRLQYGTDEPFTIVGVAADTRSVRLTFQPFPAVYVSSEDWPSRRMAIVARGLALDTVARAIRDAMRSVDPDVPLAQIVSVDAEMRLRESGRVFYVCMTSICAGLAGLLAVVGIFGVASHMTSLRTRECGIRMALGAEPRALIRLIVLQGLRPVAFGLGAGILATWWVVNLMRANAVFVAQLYKTEPHDLWVSVTTPIVLLGVGAAACWLPARRAGQVDPVRILRAE